MSTLTSLSLTAPTVAGASVSPATSAFHISARAARRIRALSEASQAKGEGALALRLAVEGGGCSGFRYDFALVPLRNATEDADAPAAIVADGATVLVDEASLALLSGAELDFTQEMIGSSFTVRNPNAVSSCGCGASFSV